MKRAIVMVLDSLGIGATRDAHWYADAGSNTLLHIAQACAEGKAEANRHGPLRLPNLNQLGLGLACEASGETFPPGLDKATGLIGAYGYAEELSVSKDAPTGHWELAGVPVMFDWGRFPEASESFPPALVAELCDAVGLQGILGNCHANGMDIIRRLGEEHMRSGKPICFTSGESVFQIAAHETYFGLERLHEVCLAAREICDRYHIARVIAQPFVGENASEFMRTRNRHEYTALPPEPTVLDKLLESGGQVYAVGKVNEHFSKRGISKSFNAESDDALLDTTLAAIKEARENTLIMSDFADFGSENGVTKDLADYASALEAIDRRLPEVMSALDEDDLLIVTADHGCDPTWEKHGYTREHIPVLMYGKPVSPGNLGHLTSFADVGQTLAGYFNLPAMSYGHNLLRH